MNFKRSTSREVKFSPANAGSFLYCFPFLSAGCNSRFQALLTIRQSYIWLLEEKREHILQRPPFRCDFQQEEALSYQVFTFFRQKSRYRRRKTEPVGRDRRTMNTNTKAKWTSPCSHTLLSSDASLLPDSILSISLSFFSESTCLSEACNEHFKSSTSLRRTEEQRNKYCLKITLWTGYLRTWFGFQWLLLKRVKTARPCKFLSFARAFLVARGVAAREIHHARNRTKEKKETARNLERATPCSFGSSDQCEKKLKRMCK